MMLRILRVLQEDPDRYDLGSLQSVWHMAAPCPAWLKEAWIELIGAEKITELYGGTEAQALTIINGVEWLEHRGSVGKPTVGEMKVLDPDGNQHPPGEVGEIYMRPPKGVGVTYRYVGAEPRARDGWESLGDLGWMDADGYLYISDRRTDLILTGGANVYPAEVEAALMEHPQVETAVVVGLPDDDLGERVHALVQADGELSEDALLAFLGDRLVRYKIPRSFRFVDEPLRDDAGKVRRTQLRDREVSCSRSLSELRGGPSREAAASIDARVRSGGGDMARKETVIVVCDLHADDVEAAGTVEIRVDDDHVTIDLCAAHLSEFRQTMSRWTSGDPGAPADSGTPRGRDATTAARRVRAAPAPRPSKSTGARRAIAAGARASEPSPADKDEVVPLRGRIPPAVQAAFDARKKRDPRKGGSERANAARSK